VLSRDFDTVRYYVVVVRVEEVLTPWDVEVWVVLEVLHGRHDGYGVRTSCGISVLQY